MFPLILLPALVTLYPAIAVLLIPATVYPVTAAVFTIHRVIRLQPAYQAILFILTGVTSDL